MAVVLTLATGFIYLRVRSDLDQAINDGLRARSTAVIALAKQADNGLAQRSSPNGEQNYAEVLTPRGQVVDASSQADRPALTAQQVQRTLRSPTVFDGVDVLGIDGQARILATAVQAQDRTRIVVVGAPVDDRNEALSELKSAYLIGAPVVVLLAAGIGYLLATLGLAPVERIRRRAERITLRGARDDERLPLPEAADEIYRLGETLNAMLDRLDNSMRRERRFVADASHELRTPITVLKSELEVAIRSSKLPTEELAAVRSALEESDRLAQLAEDLLVLARSDEGRLPVRRESIEVGRLLERVRSHFAGRADRRGREITIEAPTGARAFLDPLRIEQALQNLIDNSLRHGSGAIRVRARVENGELVFGVADQGEGIPVDQREHAFERFTHGRNAGAGGSGLGLAIVQAIAEAHGGSAWIASDGGEVRIRVPDAARSPAE